jgi:hypothetical protein
MILTHYRRLTVILLTRGEKFVGDGLGKRVRAARRPAARDETVKASTSIGGTQVQPDDGFTESSDR